ncbi:putative guanine nucleotide-binding protein-like 1 isoform X1 [Apostichopus japonicus]|uniref:Guanine nucleotide-binding protein-like 1 n=1 Tax=Stichopus japonicus TaxID=307972 RepID=A0A2G8JT90_STIJA|nr:putative guanine nucleotide-binding protein-like 1 isoform X1 [Apostichopus japonicus]
MGIRCMLQRYGNVTKGPRPDDGSSEDLDSDSDHGNQISRPMVMPISPQQLKKGYDPNRFRLQFEKETETDINRRKRQAMKPYHPMPESALEVDLADIYRPGSVLDMPKRPAWTYKMSREKVESQESKMFAAYLEKIYSSYEFKDLSYFELNLETWRQLWRVLEMSDIVLLITDIRHPAIHFPPALYNYVINDLQKHLILVLNKIDLAPPSLVVAWRSYFQEKFPDIHIVCFTSFPKKGIVNDGHDQKVLLSRKVRRSHVAVGPLQLLAACETICQGQVDLREWKQKIEAELKGEESLASQVLESITMEDGVLQKYEFFKDGTLTMGCVGHPNVGKSSLINGLCGCKVVSASRTPGHTKHFQTIFLTPSVKLCDSPGLVFPSLVDKQLQILSGMYPIAQVREPYTPVGFLAQRIPLVKILKITHPDADETSSPEWSAYDICDAWAEKRGFMTAKASRRDVYRAANNILRLAVDGKLCMNIAPVGYYANKGTWEEHPGTQEVIIMQQQLREVSCDEESDFTSSDEHADQESSHSDGTENDDNETVTSNKFALLQEC